MKDSSQIESVDKSFLEYGLAYNFRNVAPNF